MIGGGLKSKTIQSEAQGFIFTFRKGDSGVRIANRFLRLFSVRGGMQSVKSRDMN
jgi:hypothetical protein